MKITNAQLMVIQASINDLDRVPSLKLTGKTRWNLAKNLDKIEGALKPFIETKNKMLVEFAKAGGKVNTDTLEFKALVDELEVVAQQQVELELHKFPMADLNMSETIAGPGNEIPVTTLKGLSPLLNDA